MAWECAECRGVDGKAGVTIMAVCHHCGKPLCQQHQVMIADDAFSGSTRARAVHCDECRKAYHPKQRTEASRNMIQVTLETTRLIADQPNDLGLRLTNIGRGPCTDIMFRLSLPVQMVLLQGSDRIEVPLLEPGQNVATIVRVRPKQAGKWTLTSTNFSYRDAFGQSQRVTDLRFSLVAEAARTAPPPVDLMHTKLNVRDSTPYDLREDIMKPQRTNDEVNVHPHEGLMGPTTADIRRFLVDTFSGEDLKTLCFDYFRDVYDDFTTGMTKGQMIQLLIERCVRREAFPNLEAALRAERPDVYKKRFGAPKPAGAPEESAPVGRDPRQVFISYAHQDVDFAHQLAADLQRVGWRAWIAPDSIEPGEKWVEAIGRGLDGSGVFVVVLTPAAVASPWVKTETNTAVELELGGAAHFIPLDVAACAVPILWNGYQRVSFRGRYEDGLRALLSWLSGTPAADSRP